VYILTTSRMLRQW